MNFFEMSYYEDYEVSKRKALKAIDQLQVRGQKLFFVCVTFFNALCNSLTTAHTLIDLWTKGMGATTNKHTDKQFQ